MADYPTDGFGNCQECGGGHEGSILHTPECAYNDIQIKLAILRDVILATRELLKVDGHMGYCTFRGCTCGTVQDYKVARAELLRRIRKLDSHET